MRGFQNNQGTFFHCSEISERNWVLKLVSSGDVGPAARNVTKNPSQRLDTGIIPTPWWFTPECEQQLLTIGDDGRLPSSSGTTDKEDDIIVAQLNADQLKTRLKTQLEYYFSRENLNQDRYLRSQMDGDQYVPIKVVASFPKISLLTSDLDLIIQVLKESKSVQVDEINTKVRAAHRRTTLLLREIPEFTDEKEVKSMFIGCPPYTSLSYGLNNSWYVTFETEEATQHAFLHLQSLRKSFNGKPICVRIKTGPAPLTDHSDYGRYSPGKNDIMNGNLPTIVTSKGTIIGVPNNISMIVTPNTLISNNVGQEINLEKLMGPFGYSIRAIFQPKEIEPPNTITNENLNLPKITTTNENNINILGPPSTEIVESMLSAAAEANETKKREKENQMLQYQQIMENLSSSNNNNNRITDTPFIMKPPQLKRFISQESTELEIALDIQRQSRTEKKDSNSNDGFQNYISTRKKKDYNIQNQNGMYNGYEKKKKIFYETTTKDIRQDKQRSQKLQQQNYGQNNYRGNNERKYNNNNERRQTRNSNNMNYSSSSNSSYQNLNTNTNTNENYYYTDQNQYFYQQQQQPLQQLKTIVERKHENYHVNNYSKPKMITTTYVQNYQQIPVVVIPEIIPLNQENISTTTTPRKKMNSESSEYNFVDNEFPSLVEKVQKEKIKEKAKFSAVVAGKKNDEENKKSYAQTVKKK